MIQPNDHHHQTMSDDTSQQILARLTTIENQQAAIVNVLTGSMGRRGIVADIEDQRLRITTVEHGMGVMQRERERARGVIATIGVASGFIASAIVSIGSRWIFRS